MPSIRADIPGAPAGRADFALGLHPQWLGACFKASRTCIRLPVAQAVVL